MRDILEGLAVLAGRRRAPPDAPGQVRAFVGTLARLDHRPPAPRPDTARGGRVRALARPLAPRGRP